MRILAEIGIPCSQRRKEWVTISTKQVSQTAPQRPSSFPPQHQNRQPGLENDMTPLPESVSPAYRPRGKLQGKAAIISGGDSGIGRAASPRQAGANYT